MTDGTEGAPWRRPAYDGPDSPYRHAARPSDDEPSYRTLTYEVDGRVARLTFNRPEQGNSITPDTPVELAHAVERADLDPRVHVIVLSGRGKGFCGGYDLAASAERLIDGGMTRGRGPRRAPRSTPPCWPPTTTRQGRGTRWSTTR